jgi:predicted alpha/beta-fold hydrolase
MAEKLQHLEACRLDEEADRITALGDLSGVRSFWDYDERVIAPLYGFKDALDYYEQSSSRSFLALIRVPTLLLQSIDDPFMTPETVPTSEELSSKVVLEANPSGGHVGFVSGSVPSTHQYWLEQRIPEFLTAQLEKRFSAE